MASGNLSFRPGAVSNRQTVSVFVGTLEPRKNLVRLLELGLTSIRPFGPDFFWSSPEDKVGGSEI